MRSLSINIEQRKQRRNSHYQLPITNYQLPIPHSPNSKCDKLKYTD
ncbi:hypothetical protein FDUTEX481_09936 [Tolypothrix sp. PCC 7601]|nr:hypothetical protein FDUTEX481_09936 [Tolypothrix sp. PCC 7601]